MGPGSRLIFARCCASSTAGCRCPSPASPTGAAWCFSTTSSISSRWRWYIPRRATGRSCCATKKRCRRPSSFAASPARWAVRPASLPARRRCCVSSRAPPGAVPPPTACSARSASMTRRRASSSAGGRASRSTTVLPRPAAGTAASRPALAHDGAPMIAARPKLIYLVTEDWYFWSHRLPMARAAQHAGFDVAVATRVAAHGERIRAEGFALHPLRWRRRDIGPWASLRAVGEVYRLYSRERPLLVHHVALKPAVLGSVAALLAGVPAVVNAVTGVGFVASSPSLRARLLRRPMDFALARLLERPNSRVIVQNEDDRALLLSLRSGADERIVVIRGSGVDTTHFRATPEPPVPPVTAGYAGRLLADKGVAVLVEAQQSLRRRRRDARRVAGASRHHLARRGRRHPHAVVDSAYRRPAVAPRGPAEEPARTGGDGPAAHRHGCAGLPRDRP